ncbi:molybdopterin-dependent oxidoreductase [Paraburkholderia phytofirmans]|uniref:molybdopterin-dependent oxidoreductase n=1 Tax=Paraburkholderia sp. BL9I2N2 TaxID=1938809 RepID=UPI0010492182|nr:molybdopterin-dependent oxidoreductase [Paraburkholderia sp. BL9I2N2]TCK88563.1 flavin-dependent oxidoreductase [Paraburkholderia sp. BL9I2N2]
MKEIRGFCTLCRSQCGTINTVAGDRLVTVRNDPSHPTGAAMCMKGRAGPEIIEASNRILYPMKRTNPKNAIDPGWVRISWEEALQTVASTLSQIRSESGAESVAFAVTTKSGTAIGDSIEWIDRFVRVFGSPNVLGSTEICNWHKDNAHKFTFGVTIPTADYSRAELSILWGHNPTSTWLAQSEAITQGRKRGGKLIVVDPRPTPLASTADVWLQVKPGTDAALALGLSNLLLCRSRYDDEFVRNWTNAPLLVSRHTGLFLRAKDIWPDDNDSFVVWDKKSCAPRIYDTTMAAEHQGSIDFELDASLNIETPHGTHVCDTAFRLFAAQCAEWKPERVEAVTGVSIENLQQAAELIGSSKKIAYHAWTGVGQGPNAAQTERALATLYALRGCFDDVGCNRIYSKQPVNKVDKPDLLEKSQLAKAIGLSERPIGPPSEGRVKPTDVFRAVRSGKPYRIRAIVGFGTNHLATQTDVEEIRAGLQETEFHVQCDMIETPTARHADIVLPVSTPWERESLRIGFEISEDAENLIQLRPAFVKARGESRSDLDIVFDLACRLGFSDAFFGGSIEAGWNHILAPLGFTVDDLRRNDNRMVRPLEHRNRKYAEVEDGKVVGFATETRRVELYSEKFLRYGYPPVPFHLEEVETDDRYPLVLTCMKSGYYTHSSFRSITSLRKRARNPVIQMNEAVASRFDIRAGQWVRATSKSGFACFIAEIEGRLHDDVLVGDFGFWEGSEGLGVPETKLFGEGNTNFNYLVSSEQRDPISGSTNHKAVRCSIEPIEDLSWHGFREMRVSAMRFEGKNARWLRLESHRGQLLPNFVAGQYLKIRSACGNTDKFIERAYSLVSAANVDGRTTYEICVGEDSRLKGRPGVMSSFVHQILKVGDIVEVAAPGGVFTIPIHTREPVVLLATGIGITPFISYIRSLQNAASEHETILIYGNKNSSIHAFKHELEKHQKRLPSLRVVNCYTAPLDSDEEGTDYQYLGRISKDLISEELVNRGARFYMCGSAPMVKDVTALLRERGVRPFRIFSEQFVSETPASDGIPTGLSFEVKFSRSGKVATWKSADGSLLSFAEGLGIGAPSGCRVGQCESCAVRVLEGQFQHMNGQQLDEPDVALACQAIPSSAIVLDL